MFHIAPSEEGFTITWPAEQAEAAKAIRMELLLQGLRRGREWKTGTVIFRYRNELETLQTLIALLTRMGMEYSLDPGLVASRDAGQAERALLNFIQSDVAYTTQPVALRLEEFASGRELFHYQRDAVGKHLHVHHAADFSVPGSGKTTVALAYWTIARRETPGLGIWIIGPLSCFRPWEEEFEACFGRVPDALRIRGTAQQRYQLLHDAHNHEMLLCSYHTAWREATSIIQVLQRRPWLLVLDEAHYIKSMNGVLGSTVRRLAPFADRRMVLTGTPMPHSPDDLWSPFTFLWPTEALLGNAYQHSARCKRPAAQVCDELRTQLAPFFHRTCKKDLALPPVDDQYPLVPANKLPATQRLIIRLIEHRTIEEAEYLSARDRARLRRWRRARIIRLLQAVSNPLLLAQALDPEQVSAVAEDEPQSRDVGDQDVVPLTDLDSDLAAALRRYQKNRDIPAKARYVADRCRQLVSNNQKVVIWTVFLGNVDLLSKLLEDLRPLLITGEVPPYEAEDDEEGEETRERRIAVFKSDPNRRVLIANAAACSESISLHRVCQNALYLERSFNAAHFLQSLDRIHRQGMPAGTTAHVEIPHIPCAIERVLNRRLRDRQRRLFHLLDDPMPVVGFDDQAHRGFFDIEDIEGIDELFAEVLAEIRADRKSGGRGRSRGQ